MVRSHALCSLMLGIIVRRQFATCWKVLKLSSRTITLASGYFALDFFWSKTVLSELNIIVFNSLIKLKFHLCSSIEKYWKCLERDLNTRPAGYESAALTSWATETWKYCKAWLYLITIFKIYLFVGLIYSNSACYRKV